MPLQMKERTLPLQVKEGTLRSKDCAQRGGANLAGEHHGKVVSNAAVVEAPVEQAGRFTGGQTDR